MRAGFPRERFRPRSAGALGCHPRIREGFPRDRWMARDRPSPYGETGRFFIVARGPVPRDCFRPRSAGALGCHTRIRAGFPRERGMARDRPSPYGKRHVFPHPAIAAWRGTGFPTALRAGQAWLSCRCCRGMNSRPGQMFLLLVLGRRGIRPGPGRVQIAGRFVLLRGGKACRPW